MKTMLRNILLAACLASLTPSLRGQEETTGDTAASKKEIKEPAGEPKGTNVTGEETENTDSTTVDSSDVDTTDDNNRAVDDESLESRPQE